MATKTIDYKAIAINAAVTAVVIAGVNWIMKPLTQGLGAAEITLLQLPLKSMAQFAQLPIIANVNNAQFLKDTFELVDMNDPATYQTGDKRMIGNLAFVALHTNHQQYKAMALKMLDNYKKYANGQF